jgi:agmatine deiminase
MRQLAALLVFYLSLTFGCTTSDQRDYLVTSEFGDQEYIWLSWVESGFLGGEPFYNTALSAMKEITPYCKVRLFYGPQKGLSKEQLEKKIHEELMESKIDTSRIRLFYNDQYFGAIQDPGPVFLRSKEGEFALADFRFNHPDKRTELIDRNVASQFNLPMVSSEMISEGGAWQTNGRGTMLLVESVELDRNKSMTKEEIENEYKRVLGVKKIIWLKSGPKEEEWGKLDNGVYGIGTGGHIDEFCRFVDESTVLLAQVDENARERSEIEKESHRRMEENLEILRNATDQDGNPLRIIRIPAAETMTKKVSYNALTDIEKTWFERVTQDSVEFYLATSYTNFVIANGVVVTAKYWREGLPNEIALRDEQAKLALESAFPNRKIVQIDCMPLNHDGGGLHCHSRNEPRKAD